MASLARGLRKDLEKTVKQARRVAETGARKVLEQLGVHHHEPYGFMSPEQRTLRNRLRAHGRQLGDRRDPQKGTQAIGRLVQESAYEHWHRMLFARFLAETDLLIEPQSGVAITLEECQELARDEGADWLELASGYAERMLPQIFRNDDPVLAVTLPPESRSELEDLLKALPREVFTADDSLGWVYQFWQGDVKEAVNKSEKKIGADELPAVTQLFTEDYMVLFLLHNTLGAWWAGKVLAERPELATTAKSEDELRGACKVGDVEWTYLRFVRDEADDGTKGPWRPAAGTFEGWPSVAKDMTMLDPCMGSGHFLVFALPILLAIRMAEEGLSETVAVDAVPRDNLFGLEIDPRCTQIAAFNLAFAAWRRVGHRPLPKLNLACSGLAIGVTKAEWLKLAEKAVSAVDPAARSDLLGVEQNLLAQGLEERIKNGLNALYDLFAKAPWLGSLIDPHSAGADIFREGFDKLEPLLASILTAADTDEAREMAVAAQGMAKAAEILSGQFTLVTTNVPYLGQKKQDDVLKDYCQRLHPDAKADLATCFVERSLDFCGDDGSTALVTPQNWLFLGSYSELRKKLVRSKSVDFAAWLGSGAFETIGGEVVNVVLFVLENHPATPEHKTLCLDVSGKTEPHDKGTALGELLPTHVIQSSYLASPDFRITSEVIEGSKLLEQHAISPRGVVNGDQDLWLRFFWEVAHVEARWRWLQSAVRASVIFGGRERIIDWSTGGDGMLRPGHANPAYRKLGVAVSRMSQLPAALYTGELYDQNSAVLVPTNAGHLPALWVFSTSPDFASLVRKLDKKLGVTPATLLKVPFDLAHWQKVAAKKYPHGLPKPFSSDPTQWLFIGHPAGADLPLQVAVARLLGYQWPRQTGSSFPDCPAIAPDGLEKLTDQDGIVCLAATKGEAPAHERIVSLLVRALGVEWSAAKLSGLLADVGYSGKSLDDWLRDAFFAQHCELFHQRPFIWHIWDGRRDGFHALVHYHRLAAPNGEGRRTLEKLIYSYLGDWIDRQRADQKASVEGADARLAHAEHLKAELIKILEGEAPYDIFVRWKLLHEQPVGWDPDINDGVRMNIRPFMTAHPLGARGSNASILRATLKIKWDKDRGKEPMREKEDHPWFWGWDPNDPDKANDFEGGGTFDGNRWNNLHYTRAFKEAAQARQASKAGVKL